MLENYLKNGVDKLDDKELATILLAKHGSFPDEQKERRAVNEIRTTFIDFQQHLYSAAVG